MSPDSNLTLAQPSFASALDARRLGMSVAFTAQRAPQHLAIASQRGNRTYGELNAHANQLVRVLRAGGIRAGDSIAVMCSNRPEFAEIYSAALRAGLRLTPINWHLQADEVAYIVDNCEARAFVAEARVAEVAAGAALQAPKAELRLAIGGPISGFRSYEVALSEHSPENIEDPSPGATMLYTSGTTGRPKGVRRPRPSPGSAGDRQIMEREHPLRHGSSVVLCTGPLYHAAPLAFDLNLPLLAGVSIVLMDHWDAEETLRLIERHQVSHSHMVSTMFQRLLALPDETRSSFDLSSLRRVNHGAAPTPVHVKRAILDWWGPVLYEYYAGTEGGGTRIGPKEWLEKPGSVGRVTPGRELEILNDLGEALPPGEVGSVYFSTPSEGAFEYFGDDDKTRGAFRGDRFTLGDHGYLDHDGYLFLTGRTSELIISGGVNIYPAEVDAILLMHPAVADVGTVGVPNEEFGEEVKAVVQLAEGVAASDALAVELREFCRDRLAHYKCPKSVDFVSELPRSEAGKVMRRRVRDPYWEGYDRQM